MSKLFWFTFRMCNTRILNLKLYFVLIIENICIFLKEFKGFMCNQNKIFDQDRVIFFWPGNEWVMP